MSDTSRPILSIFLIFLRLGLTSFGGPVAHLGYFRQEFVTHRRWLSDRDYSDLVALCQFLPGPASSQVGLAIGLQRAGYRGALAAWLGFTLPSALAMIMTAFGLAHAGDAASVDGIIHGLKIVAVAVVIQAVWGMGQAHCKSRLTVGLMIGSAVWVMLTGSVWSQVIAIVLAGIIGAIFVKAESDDQIKTTESWNLKLSGVWLAVFGLLLFGLPLATQLISSPVIAVFDTFYRAGALVFGGGHVVLPLLHEGVVANGWVSADSFIAGYGAAQALPGPLFTFAAYLGASLNAEVSGWFGGLFCLVAIFLPSFLLIAGALPFWHQLRTKGWCRSVLVGANAAVVGLLLAALYNPLWSNSILSAKDFSACLLLFFLIVHLRLPPWIAVIIGIALGWSGLLS